MQSERAGKSSVVEQKGPEGGGAYLSMVLEQIKGKLVVSCQALPHEPLHSSYIMSRMAVAAMEGGAAQETGFDIVSTTMSGYTDYLRVWKVRIST